MLSLPEATKLEQALYQSGWDDEMIRKLCEPDCEILKDALYLLRGDVEIVPVNHIINLWDDPILEENEQIIRHIRGAKRKPWNKIKMTLMNPDGLHYTREYTSRHNPKTSLTMLDKGRMLPRFIRGQKLPNIHMRDFLLKNQHLIPQSWHKSWLNSTRPILFWGTIVVKNKGEYETAWVPGIVKEHGSWVQYNRRIDTSTHDIEDYESNLAAVFI